MLKISVDTSGIKAVENGLEAVCSPAEHAVAVQMEKDTRPYVPALTLSMANRTRVIGNAIYYTSPYARYLYYGKLMVDPNTGSSYAPKGGSKVLTDTNLVFTRTVNSNAQAFWCEASKAENLDKWENVAKKALKKYGKH